MSDAEEMLQATLSRHRNASDMPEAGPRTPAHAGLNMSQADNCTDTSGGEPLVNQRSPPATPTSRACRPVHEGDHVRNARLSTSDARKANRNLSSSLVALSSGTVRSGTWAPILPSRASCSHSRNSMSQQLQVSIPIPCFKLQIFNEKHASSHLGIPLGALIAPALPQHRPEKAQHEPVCCSSCDAYLNMYSEVRGRTSLVQDLQADSANDAWQLETYEVPSSSAGRPARRTLEMPVLQPQQ